MVSFFEGFSPSLIQNSILILALGEVILLGLLILFWFRLRKIRADLSVFFSGKEAKNLDTVLLEQLKEVRALDQEIQELFGISNQLRELCLKSLHKTNVVRFNPFKEVGGNQSFSVVLLDGKNSGVVISSLHTREGTRVYAKPVALGEANGFPLTEEEKLAITQAIQNKPTSKV
ncbi:MAG: DUF4446 family protein [Candidatus Moranbacteria bacterium]|nr:DUF4446 family protein [Candidatus Moranbacteria bacterium]